MQYINHVMQKLSHVKCRYTFGANSAVRRTASRPMPPVIWNARKILTSVKSCGGCCLPGDPGQFWSSARTTGHAVPELLETHLEALNRDIISCERKHLGTLSFLAS